MKKLKQSIENHCSGLPPGQHTCWGERGRQVPLAESMFRMRPCCRGLRRTAPEIEIDEIVKESLLRATVWAAHVAGLPRGAFPDLWTVNPSFQ